MPRVLVVGCGFPQVGLIRFCKQEGLDVVGADVSPEAVGVSLCDRYVRVSIDDASGLAAAGRDLHVDGIVSAGSEGALRATRGAAESLGLPFYADEETLERCLQKDRMREALAAHGVPVPAFVASRDEAGVRAFVEMHGLPVVVKPSHAWGQRGVSIVRHERELAPATVAALVATKSDGTILVEEFVGEREFSVNAYTHEGMTEVLAVTERIITGYPKPPGITYAEIFPSEIPTASLALVSEVARRTVAALGVRRGPTYTQLRWGSGGAFPIETAHRLGGGLDPEVTFLASGYSLYRRIVGVAVGRPDWETMGREATPHGGAVGRFLVGTPGVIASIDGLDEARTQEGVIDAQVYPKSGGRVYPLTDGSKRIGHALTVGADREQADCRARRALETIRLTMETA